MQELPVLHTFILALTCLSHSLSLSFSWVGLYSGVKSCKWNKSLLKHSKHISLWSVKAWWRSDLPDMVIEGLEGSLNWVYESSALDLYKSDVFLCVNKEACCIPSFLFRSPLHHHSLYLLIRSLAFLPSLFQSNFLCHACLLSSRCSFAYSKSFPCCCPLLVALSAFSLRNHCTLWFINTAGHVMRYFKYTGLFLETTECL